MSEAEWAALPKRFPSVMFDAHRVMPNHTHDIIVIPGRGLEPALAHATGAPVIQPYSQDARRLWCGRRISLPAVAGAFKSLSAIAVNKYFGRTGTHVWQEDYYEHIIGDVEELGNIRDYIIHNPERWTDDRNNPDAA